MNKKLKKQIPNIIFGIIFLVGLAVFLYPSVSNYINSKNQSRVISSYQEALNSFTEEDYSRLWEAAYAYNEALVDKRMNFELSDE